jgi:ADP-ribose pyrophosphatase YjhB (NUDIX family)
MNPQWLTWMQQLQAIAQSGLTYTENQYDIDRYQQVHQIATQIMATYGDSEPAIIKQLFQQEQGYATPKVAVRGAVFRDDRLLLVKEKVDGCWTLPGGWVDVGESPSDSVVREVYEESGYETRVVKLLMVCDRLHPRYEYPPYPYHVYKMFFQCELLGGTATDNYETESAEFFAENEIPELSLERVVPVQITRLFEHYRHPELSTDFD